MPRIPRGQVAGHAYHVLNRGNGGAAVFHKDGDYTAFVDLLATAKAKYPVKVVGFCLMPNHFHLIVQPATDAALSPFMQWWMTSHVRRYHRHDRSHGMCGKAASKVFRFNTTRISSRSSATCSAILSARGWSSTRWTGPGRACDSRICATPLPSRHRPTGSRGSISRSSIMNSPRSAPA